MPKKSKLDSEESEMLLTEGVDKTIAESVSNDPDAVTPQDRAFENEAERAAEIDVESNPEIVKHGVILTGGIDSTVMLYQIKNTQPEAKIVPIVFKGSSMKYISPFLDDLGIKAESKSFTISDETNPENYDKLITWAEDNKIWVLHFAANHDEGEESIEHKNFDFFQRLRDIAADHKVQISTPFQTVTKDKIIQMAVDLYDIDLSKTAPPSLDEISIRIREKGFKQAFSLKHQKWLEDPYKPKTET